MSKIVNAPTSVRQRVSTTIKNHTWASRIVGLAFLVMSFLVLYHYLFGGKDAEAYNFSDMVQELVQVLGFLATGLLVYISIVREEKSSRESASQQIYQQLEIESIALFRFDIDHTDLARYIWGTCPLPQEANAHDDDFDREYLRLIQYVAQHLNLFEMAVRFRIDGIMSPDVFGSWVIWICNLCECDNFREIWQDPEVELQWNYIKDFREIVNEGVDIFDKSEKNGRSVREGRKDFFEYVGTKINCPIVLQWYNEPALTSESKSI